jgi:hypothetical protein
MMEQSPFWEAYSHSAKKLLSLMEVGGSLPCSHGPANTICNGLLYSNTTSNSNNSDIDYMSAGDVLYTL